MFQVAVTTVLQKHIDYLRIRKYQNNYLRISDFLKSTSHNQVFGSAESTLLKTRLSRQVSIKNSNLIKSNLIF